LDYIIRAAENVRETDLRVTWLFCQRARRSRRYRKHREENLSDWSRVSRRVREYAENYFACAQRLSSERAWNKIVFSGDWRRKSSYYAASS